MARRFTVKNVISYEYIYEHINEDMDIVEVIHFDCPNALKRYFDDPTEIEGCMFRKIGVLYSMGNDEQGELDRGYAYIDPHGDPGETFDNGRKMPVTIRRSLKRIMNLLHTAERGVIVRVENEDDPNYDLIHTDGYYISPYTFEMLHNPDELHLVDFS